MRRIFAIGVILSSGLLAQGRGQNPAKNLARAIDVTRQQTIEGNVTAINLAYGVQYPSMLVNGRLIKLAPVWVLLQNNFEVRIGDPVQVEAAPSTLTMDAYLYAFRVANRQTNTQIELRDMNGYPLWSGGKKGGG